MMGGRTSKQWVEQYASSHNHPVNRFCHTLGIPMITASLPLFAVALLVKGFWVWPLGLFVAGWILQFVGHAFEGKPPEFFKDYRFLFVGVRWWWAKMSGKV